MLDNIISADTAGYEKGTQREYSFFFQNYHFQDFHLHKFQL